jgi:urease gamma subunit
VTGDQSTAAVLVGPARQGLSVVEIDGCVSIFNPATQRAVILNITATMVWHLSDGTRDADTIAAELAARFGLEPDRVQADVAAAIDRMRIEQLFDDDRSA